MGMSVISMGDQYWETFELENQDVEFLYNHLLEIETPLTTDELIVVLIDERIRRFKQEVSRQRASGGDLYQPKGSFTPDQKLVFPALGWQRGQVSSVRPGHNPALGEFEVIAVKLEDGTQRQFAAGLEVHKLNEPPTMTDDFEVMERAEVMEVFGDALMDSLDDGLKASPEFVRIAAKWFPRALLIDIHVGHLNLAEAVLEMAEGGPLSTTALIEQIGLSTDANSKLVEFSMDLALQEDQRFDEVGPSGDVLWYLRRLEPPEVLNTPVCLRYHEADFERGVLTNDMLALEKALDDELSPPAGKIQALPEGEVRLIYPHWRAGTLPLSARVRHLFPTAYEAPRVRFMLVDGDTNQRFPGWVVREKRYVYGLQAWYETKGLMPGSIVKIRKGKQPGEVIIQSETRRPSREWVRTVLVGSDGGVVFAMLKQIVNGPFDDRMAIAIPDRKALDQAWQSSNDQAPLEKIVTNAVRELAKLNPQSHVHASELYAAVNITRRCPPGPILAVLASRPWFTHVGDLHFRLSDAED